MLNTSKQPHIKPNNIFSDSLTDPEYCLPRGLMLNTSLSFTSQVYIPYHRDLIVSLLSLADDRKSPAGV